MTLDPHQRAAVDHDGGPCLVLAGPGSGKTRVIVERFIALTERGIPAGRQLVLTYTRKAADEMRERAEEVHGPFPGEPPLTTYHAFAGRVVREWGWCLNVSPAFRIPDEAERWLHLEAVLAELRPLTLWNPLRPHDLVDALLHLIGAAKQELVTPQRYGEWATVRLATEADPAARALLERHRDCADAYELLEKRYRRHAVLDHDDCILYAERLLRERPAARQAIAGAIDAVMVDEYQDTNFAQAKLIETLVTSHRNVMVVADDDQAIYKFRGASRANLDRFARIYPEHRKVVLSRNYRSTPSIVRAAQAMIGAADAASRFDKLLTADRPAGVPVEIWNGDDEAAETLAVASECRTLIENGTAPGAIAWLFRVHADMQPAIRALRHRGVPFRVHGGRGFFQRTEIKDLLALFAAIAEPGDHQAVLRCLHLPAWAVSPTGRRALVQAQANHDGPLHDLVTAGAVVGLGEADGRAAAACVQAILDLHATVEREDVRDLLFAALEASRFLGIVDQRDEQVRRQIGANLSKFGDLIEAFIEWNDDRRLRPALRYFEILRNSRDADQIAATDDVEDGITLLTAHSAKGLEWPVVFLTGCVAQRWPGRGGPGNRMPLPDELVPEPPPLGDGLIDEERRLFYVAATRARDRLVLSRARRYPRSWKDEPRTPFLDPLISLKDDVVAVDVPPGTGIAQAARRRIAIPTSDRITVSVTDLQTHKDCPRRFAYRRVYHMPTMDSVQKWYGTLIHGVLQVAAARRSNDDDIDGIRIAELWQRAWDDARGPKGRHPELRAYGEDQLRRYVESPLWQGRRIVAAEAPFTLPLTAAAVAGRFDRIDDRGNSPVTVVDYKTSPPRDPERASGDLQVRAYAVALSQRDRVDDVVVELHYLQTTESVAVSFGKADLERAYRHLSATAADVAAAWRQAEYPPRPSRWQCPRCEYRTVCDEGRDIRDAD